MLEKRCLDFIEADETTLPSEIKMLRTLLGGRFATPTQMLELGHGIEVVRGQKAATKYNRQTGARSIVYSETDKPIDVPSLFMIAVPVFDNGAAYRIPAQIRFRVNGEGEVVWQYELHRVKESIEHAVKGMVEQTTEKTGLPIYTGCR